MFFLSFSYYQSKPPAMIYITPSFCPSLRSGLPVLSAWHPYRRRDAAARHVRLSGRLLHTVRTGEVAEKRIDLVGKEPDRKQETGKGGESKINNKP